MSKVAKLHKQWLEDEEYRDAYDALEPEFALSRAVIKARTRAKLTQEELAERMKTSQTAIARLESGQGNPTAQTLRKLAEATGTTLTIRFE